MWVACRHWFNSDLDNRAVCQHPRWLNSPFQDQHCSPSNERGDWKRWSKHCLSEPNWPVYYDWQCTHKMVKTIYHRCDTYDIRKIRAMWGAECWTNNRPVRTVLLLHIVTKLYKKPKLIWPSFNTKKLQHIKYHKQFAASLDNNLISHGPLTGNTTPKMGPFQDFGEGISRVNIWTEEESSPRLIQCKWWKHHKQTNKLSVES